MVELGRLIEAELRRQEKSVSWLADKLCCERSNVYDIFTRRSLDTELMAKLSLALGVDFFVYCQQDLCGRMSDVLYESVKKTDESE